MNIATMLLRRRAEDTATAVEFGRTVGLELPVLAVVDRLFGEWSRTGMATWTTARSSARSAGGTASGSPDA